MKNTKKVLLRIYSRHDLDLVALRSIKEFDMNGAIKYVLREYIKGTPVKMQIPIIPDFTNAKFKSFYTIFLSLDEVKDSDIISFLDTIKPYCRNVAIKTIFRASLLNLPLSVFNKTNNVFTNDYVNALNKSIENEVSSFSFYKPVLKKKRYSSNSEKKNTISLRQKDNKNNENTTLEPVLVNTSILSEVKNNNISNKNHKDDALTESNINSFGTTDNMSLNNTNKYIDEQNVSSNNTAKKVSLNNLDISYMNLENKKEPSTPIVSAEESHFDNNFDFSENSVDINKNMNNNTSDSDNDEDMLDDVDMDFMNAFSSMLSQSW